MAFHISEKRKRLAVYIMTGAVRFKRVHNRTAADIYRNMIRPRVPMALDDLAQKIVYYARHNHGYQNRTGALEESVTWVPAKAKGNRWTVVIMAGGSSKTTRTYSQRIVFYYDEQHRLRVFEPKNPRITHKGQPIYVNYAIFVELKGFQVLKHAIEKYRRQAVQILSKDLKTAQASRFYTFKYSGERVDLGSLN